MTKVKQSKQLVSQDYNSNTYNYKYVFSVEIPKICKDDLVAIPNKLCVALGGCSPVLLCSKVFSSNFYQILRNFRKDFQCYNSNRPHHRENHRNERSAVFPIRERNSHDSFERTHDRVHDIERGARKRQKKH